MATTHVLIRDELGLRVPSERSVKIVLGDSVTFTADSGVDSSLYFSQSAAAILTPSPESPVSLSSGASVSYTFSSPSGLAYGVIVQAPEVSAPTDFDLGPPAEPPMLVIQTGEGSSFPGPVQPIKTGA
jgi:hypothetical protein